MKLLSAGIITSGVIALLALNLPGTTNFVIDEKKFQPRHYVCQRTTDSIIIDGKLDDTDWQNVPWTDYFVDIEGTKKPHPWHNTRVKMLWDDQYVYIGAELEESHIQATLRQRDTVIFYDNDFEIFLDPDGDTHNYLEYEVNAFGTFWDLLLTKPYRDGGFVFNRWDISGIRQAIGIQGTINNPSDEDHSWVVEVAIPHAVTREANRNKMPEDGALWRLNFSRVEWNTDISDGRYVKRVSAEGRRLPEENWVWSPQGVINMHWPEMWGFLRFSDTVAGEKSPDFQMPQEEWIKWALRNIYYQQTDFIGKYGKPGTLKELKMERITIGKRIFKPEISLMGKQYQARIQSPGENRWWNIRADGYVWAE